MDLSQVVREIFKKKYKKKKRLGTTALHSTHQCVCVCTTHRVSLQPRRPPRPCRLRRSVGRPRHTLASTFCSGTPEDSAIFSDSASCTEGEEEKPTAVKRIQTAVANVLSRMGTFSLRCVGQRSWAYWRSHSKFWKAFKNNWWIRRDA